MAINLQREITNLHNELKEAKEVAKQQSAAYSKLEQENKELREKLRKCIEEDTEPNPLTSRADSEKGPWLD